MTGSGFVKSILKFSISNIVNFVLGFISVILLTRLFLPEQYGFLNIFNNTVALVLSIVYLGLDSSYIRFYNEPLEKDKGLFSLKLILISLMSNFIIIFLLIVIGGTQVANTVFGEQNKYIWIFVGLSVSAQLILRYLNIIYRMSFRSKQYNIQSVLVVLATKFFVILAAIFGQNYIDILGINVIGVVGLSGIYIYVQRKDILPQKWTFGLKKYGPVFKYAVFSAPLAIGINFNNFLNQQIIARSKGNYYVGIYSSAGYFSSILVALQGGFTTYWSAFMYSNYKKEQELIKKVHDYVVLACICLMFCFICFRDVIYLFIGKQYYESKDFFSLVLVYPMLSLISETTVYGISLAKKNYYILISYVISIIVNLAFSAVLTPKIGLVGTAISNALSGVVLLLISSSIGQRLYVSIQNVRKTTIGVVLLISLSIFSTFFYAHAKVMGIIGTMIITLLLYKENIREMFWTAKNMVKRIKR